MPDPLRILNAMILSDRRERQSDKEMALSAAMFKIRQGNAELDRLNDMISESAGTVKEAKKELDGLLKTFSGLGATAEQLKEVSPGISTDIDAVIGLNKSDTAGRVKAFQDRIKAHTIDKDAIYKAMDTIKGQMGEYYLGAGEAAVDVFREGFAGEDNVFNAKEFRDAMEHLKTTEKYKDVATHPLFESGVSLGVQKSEKHYTGLAATEALKNKRETTKPTTNRAEKMLGDYNTIADDWARFETWRAGKPAEGVTDPVTGEIILQKKPAQKPDQKAVERKEAQFKRRIKLFQKKYPGQKIVEDFFPTEEVQGGVTKSLSEMSIDELLELAK